MASRATNEAVEQYRRLAKAEMRVEEEEEKLTRLIGRTDCEIDEYVRMTVEIDQALDGSKDLPRPIRAGMVNRAGLDSARKEQER